MNLEAQWVARIRESVFGSKPVETFEGWTVFYRLESDVSPFAYQVTKSPSPYYADWKSLGTAVAPTDAAGLDLIRAAFPCAEFIEVARQAPSGRGVSAA